MMIAERASLLGWGAVAASVVGYDAWALITGHETLSSAFWRGKRQKRTRIVLTATWLGLTYHLLLGDVEVLSPAGHLKYKKYHPLWACHSVLVRRASLPSVVLQP